MAKYHSHNVFIIISLQDRRIEKVKGNEEEAIAFCKEANKDIEDINERFYVDEYPVEFKTEEE